MTKPASGTGLDTGNSLYSHLTAANSGVWAMLEGGGTTSADSSGNGRTLTLNNSGSGVTWTTIGGDPALAFAGSTAQAAAIGGTAPDIAGTSSWSLAWRGKQTVSGNSGDVCGEESASNRTEVFMRGGNALRFVPHTGDVFDDFTSVTDFTADHDYLLVYDQPGGKLHLYQDGAEVTGSPLTVTANDAELKIISLGSGYDGAGTHSLVGTLTYVYLMDGYAASSTDASNLHANPYSVFASPAAGTPAPRAALAAAEVNPCEWQE